MEERRRGKEKPDEEKENRAAGMDKTTEGGEGKEIRPR